MNTKSQKIFSICIKVAFVAAVVCSTAYLLMLGWFNNFLLDDYSFITFTDQDGAYGLMHDAYWNWQSRFSAFYVLGWILQIWGHASNLIGYTILLLVLGYGTIYYALRTFTCIPNRWLLVGSSIIITNVAVMAYLELSTFYWVCCALYTLSTYAAILLFTAIFFSKGKLWLRWILVILSSLYLCGGAENFTPLIIASLGIMLIYQMIQSRSWIFWRTHEQQMMIVSVVILAVGFLIVLAGPGTQTRAVTENSAGFMGQFALMPFFKKIISASVIFAMRLASRGLYYILLFPIGMLIGNHMTESQDKILKKVLISFVAMYAIIELSIVASVYGMGWFASLRAYSFVSFMVAAWVMYWGVLVGRKYRNQLASWLCVLSFLLIISISTCFIRIEYPLVKDYHAQIERTNNLIQEQVRLGRTEPLYVEPVTCTEMPNTYAILRSAMNKCLGKSSSAISAPATYFPYERYGLTIDPNHWKNRDIQWRFGAEFNIIGWEESND